MLHHFTGEISPKREIKKKKTGLAIPAPSPCSAPDFFHWRNTRARAGCQNRGWQYLLQPTAQYFSYRPDDVTSSLSFSFFLSRVLHLFFAGCVFSRFFLLFFLLLRYLRNVRCEIIFVVVRCSGCMQQSSKNSVRIPCNVPLVCYLPLIMGKKNKQLHILKL